MIGHGGRSGYGEGHSGVLFSTTGSDLALRLGDIHLPLGTRSFTKDCAQGGLGRYFAISRLLAAQGGYGVDAGCTMRRNVACQHRDESEACRHGCECGGISGLNSVEQFCHQS
jgi:hypothetical protein